ncbi:Uncharacterised protein [Brevibacterium casei]|uniref:Uncharacterized protein n=1 Tax=Brevibacterium casei TaxID=33889 RepID=A0A449D7V2_9MICO|nr:hypothetical protein [Brevibacterium casei]VEW13576.1 Uncharacterised protein [Brevibacterium casei]
MNLSVPPFWERFWRAIGHLQFLGGAIYSSVGTLPKSMLIAADEMQLTLWALCGATGLFGAWAAFRGRYKLEYAVLPFMGGSTLIYIIALLAVVLTDENPGSGLALFYMTSLGCYQAARWCSLNQLLDGPLKQLLDGPLRGWVGRWRKGRE